jgi:hypothetical protein
MRIIMAVGLLLTFMAPVGAQTVRQFDRIGQPTGQITREGSHFVQRDLNANPHGYWVKEGRFMVHRNNVGNQLGRVEIK